MEELGTRIRKQADFISELTFGQLRSESVRAAKRIVLDTLGCMAAGSCMQKPKTNGDALPAGSHTIVGLNRSYGKEWAVFVNGFNVVATEMDEGNGFAKGHPAAHFMPALLAESETGVFSGQTFLTAVTAAYEVTVRWGSAVTLRSSIHPHGNWGIVGAAAAAAKLRGAPADRIKEAMLLSLSLPIPSAWASAFTGSNVRHAYVGVSNLLGMMGLDMAGWGAESNEAVLASVYRDILGTGLAAEFLDQELGRRYYIEQNYMKIYACCRYVHGAVDGLLKLVQKGLHPEQIDSVTVETYKAASLLAEPNPANELAAKFSIPFSLAMLLCRGSVGPELYRPGVTEEEDLLLMASRIEIREDAALTAQLPHRRPTRITVALKNGEVLVEEVGSATGEFDSPLSEGQLEDKFHALTETVWGAERRRSIIQTVWGLERLDDMSKLTGLLPGGIRGGNA
ncbi:MmgE/PrpD family protein [Paenibacillus chartarius]|uniref:MmgE/PrpD family protein n=1 Tax=Paenibacillus chartarius TaxID=747481 RepID=A0ABV6DI08_9BACL